MISVEEAFESILSHFSPLPAEKKIITAALGQVLAEDVQSNDDIPPFNNSAMDGYAVRYEDVAESEPGNAVELKVIADLAAGYAPDMEVTPGTAVRIMTGAPVPPGADTVVRFEDTNESEKPYQGPGSTVLVLDKIAPGENVRMAGEDIRSGEVVVERGTVVRPSVVGVLASLGRKEIMVHRRPRVAILSTGDELVDITEPITPGKIRNSNSYSLAALVLRYGGEPLPLGIARDTREALSGKLKEALEADLILTSGGVSVGDYDLVKKVLNAEGKMDFWQVCMKPGKPLAFGHISGVPLLGLPGNPVSVMISFEQFGRPALLRMLGRTDLQKPTIKAIMDDDAPGAKGRRHFVRVAVAKRDGIWHARTTGEQGSGILSSMLKANGLAVVPEDTSELPAGSEVTVQMLDCDDDCA